MSADPAHAFEAHFGREPELAVLAPGRVNVIGDHTDYNEGWVLPAAIDRSTIIAASSRRDKKLRICSVALRANDVVSLDDLHPGAGAPWTKYIRGAAALLQKAGVELPGGDLLIDGTLPLGVGLSSSASVTVAGLAALLRLAGAHLDLMELARMGQRVENDIVGVASGIMDQLAVVFGRASHALLIDCRSVAIEPVPIPVGYRLLILDSGIPRQLAESAYNQRRAECERALTVLRRIDPTVVALRDATPELLASAGSRLDPVHARRARHVVSEDQRVLDAAEALRRGDVGALGFYMLESHASLRDDFEVSVAELDQLVAIAMSEEGVVGARLTGAGFGGCAVAVVHTDFADEAARRIVSRYRQQTGLSGAALRCDLADGVRTLYG